uniref:Uncharacterized protein n=1 Tax=uncultured Desulfobacterium sp. TaxID=201089 RepID=E1YIB0_9BACT|nr:unknown protein [uncultured Desulfobacterium sp.]
MQPGNALVVLEISGSTSCRKQVPTSGDDNSRSRRQEFSTAEVEW